MSDNRLFILRQLAIYSLVNFLLTILLITSPLAYAAQREMPTLTILADSTLSVPVSRLALQYSRTANVSVSTVFQLPSLHQKNIEDGEPADLLITADSELIERLTQKGLADVKSPTVIASAAPALPTLPDEQSGVHYTGLVVASENMEKARAMLAYMTSDEAKAILKEAGL